LVARIDMQPRPPLGETARPFNRRQALRALTNS
jgi:hypothetical protein